MNFDISRLYASDATDIRELHCHHADVGLRSNAWRRSYSPAAVSSRDVILPAGLLCTLTIYRPTSF